MKDHTRILLIDDDEDDYIIAKDLLAEIQEIDYELDWVQTYDEGLALIRQELHQIYLVDYHLGEKNGLKLIKEVIDEGFKKPFIVLTGQGNRKLDLEAMQIGASDYLVKGQLTVEILERSIRYSLRANQADIANYNLEKQLFQAQKMECIGSLAGGIAHDFNNILSSILGYTELAFEDVQKGSQLHDTLMAVYKAGNRARDLVKRILTFARQAKEEIKPLLPAPIALETVSLLRSSIPSTIEIRHNITSNSQIMADSTQMHQIFMNLCTNASHAMEKNGGILNIEISDINIDCNSNISNLKSGNYLKIAISDTGIGISEELIPSIFEPYFSTRAIGEGTGLGLAMVDSIVKNYKGAITVESCLGKGTTFKIYLPTTHQNCHSVPCMDNRPAKGTERILFIDDEEPIVKMSSRLLRGLGYHVTCCTSSTDAIELFQEKSDDFDLIITDMTMPNLTGDKLARKLIAIKPKIPIILSTGYLKKDSNVNFAECGIKALIHKPVLIPELARIIREVLDNASNNE
ncbi:MAG: hypothetical protein CVV64_20185 [Candidatus Wallbacteria bacterium HGW-Wallbacteria-1]|jgi:signal transduction histidine kinase|uniref:histidine kinase n=1 Tax=Candidatus Wallbacteria bacterium HGW-Wallbacteria-1 TaxID=2013854 RepID=A0A2N1PIF3_9BACT|nr:MAG: hypothetical protein CVV64_20185 [Candidatus Wallbacteria bacterium HGW-Wallbacteria-1]